MSHRRAKGPWDALSFLLLIWNIPDGKAVGLLIGGGIKCLPQLQYRVSSMAP